MTDDPGRGSGKKCFSSDLYVNLMDLRLLMTFDDGDDGDDGDDDDDDDNAMQLQDTK